MALKYCYHKYENSHETEQFSELLPKLANYFSKKQETAFFVACGEMKLNGRAFDALLLTPYVVVGIEFKNYAKDGDIVRVIDNDVAGSWLVYHSDGQPVMEVKDGVRQLLSVEGGTFSNPYKQAYSNRQKLRDSLIELGMGKTVLKDVEDYSRRVPYFIVFTKNLDLESKCEMLRGTKQWLKVTTNNQFISVLDSKIGQYTIPAFTYEEILNFLNRWGFGDLRDPSEWSQQKYEIEHEENSPSDKQNTPRNSDFDKNNDYKPSTSMQDMEIQRSQFMRMCVNLVQNGDMVFLFLMSFVMSATMACLWWWKSQSNIINIGMLLIMAFIVGFCFFIRKDHQTRKLHNNGECVDGIFQMKGVNKFSFGSVFLCHLGWLMLAALFFLSADPLRDQIPASSDRYYGAFYALLRLMCVLLKNCAAVFGSITLLSLLFRLLNLRDDTFHEKSSPIISCLAMMPCTRSDISSDKSTVKEYWDDLWKWFRTLIAMSACVVIFWGVLTLLFDRELFVEKFRYWPLRQIVEKTNMVDTSETQFNDKPDEQRTSGPDNSVTNKEPAIQEKTQKLVKVISLSFSQSSVHMRYGETYNLRQLLVVEPQDANEPLHWSVANNNYLSIDNQTGVLTSYMSGNRQFAVAVISDSQKAEATIMINSRE